MSNGQSFAEVARQHADSPSSSDSQFQQHPEQPQEQPQHQDEAAPLAPGFSSNTDDNKPEVEGKKDLGDLMEYARNAGEDEFPALGSGPAHVEDDDVLGSALSNAFSFPTPPPAPTPSSPPTASSADLPPMPNAAFPDSSQPPRAGQSANPDPRPNHTGPVGPESPEELGMWKDEYEQQQRDWKAESKMIRDKAERVRGDWLKIREEEEKNGKAQAGRLEAERKRLEAEEKQAKEEKNVGGEKGGKSGNVAKDLGLEGSKLELASKGVEGSKVGEDAEKWRKAEQAWKGVGEEKKLSETGNGTESDLRIVDGVTVETIVSGIAADPNPSSTATIEPTLKGVPSAAGNPITNANHIVDPHGSSSSKQDSSSSNQKSSSSNDAVSSLNPEKNSSEPADLPISSYLLSSTSPNKSTPPSLTLALFTSTLLPPRRRILLGLACLGINILLPFVGGMMAGFGEITAKGLQGMMRDVWFGTRGEGSAGVGGVGLSGIRGAGREGGIERRALKENPMREAFP